MTGPQEREIIERYRLAHSRLWPVQAKPAPRPKGPCASPLAPVLMRRPAPPAPPLLVMDIPAVQRIVASHYAISRAAIMFPDREARVARTIAIALARNLTAASLPQIGRAFGIAESTVAAAVTRTRVMSMRDPAFGAKVDHLRNLILKFFNVVR